MSEQKYCTEDECECYYIEDCGSCDCQCDEYHQETSPSFAELPQAVMAYAEHMKVLQHPNHTAGIKTFHDFHVKNHQTLVVCLAHCELSDPLQERMTRFVTSLNTASTIKADVYTYAAPDEHGNQYRYGLHFAGKQLTGKPDFKALKQMAKDRGWRQVIFLEDTGV